MKKHNQADTIYLHGESTQTVQLQIKITWLKRLTALKIYSLKII